MAIDAVRRIISEMRFKIERGITNTALDVENYIAIVESLEKQLPKTPMQNFYNEGDYTWECVNCEEAVDEGQNYCHNCGQKLVERES